MAIHEGRDLYVKYVVPVCSLLSGVIIAGFISIALVFRILLSNVFMELSIG